MPNRTIKVLYIDDDAALGRFVQRILGRRGYQVDHVTTAEDGLVRLDEGEIDAVILDHDLGATSGLAVLEDLKAREQAPPVVYVTASTELSIAVQALKAGAVDYVVKAIGDDFEVLLVAALEQAVERARLMRAKEAAEQEVRQARDRAEMLLAEVNHRVANSLALVSSLVRMQAGAVKEAGAKAALAETQARITAIANLHRSLYTSTDVQRVDLAAYLETLVGELGNSITASGRTPIVKLDAEPVSIKTDRAVSVGMIATELVTNALKYAYPAGEGEVRVSITRTQPNQITLSVADDGIGWTRDGTAKGSGLGAKIIAAMSKSLGSHLEYRSQPIGTLASITFDEKLG